MKFTFILTVFISIASCGNSEKKINENAISENFPNGNYKIGLINDSNEASSELTIIFNDSLKTVSGYSGCNRFTGSYEINGSNIKIGPLAATRMSCHEEKNAVESKMLEALTNANNFQNSVTVTFTGGNSDFSIPDSFLTNIGTTTIAIISLIPMNSMCSADVTLITSADFIVFDNITPEIIEEGNIFCEQDEPTISDLTASIVGNAPITWYDDPNVGTIYSDTTLLEDGETYYASTLTAEGCESIPRLEVTVQLDDCPNDIIIPDGFSPNGDNINDDFNIVNLRDLYPNFTLEVYNRYGNILYKGNIDTPNWNGYSEKGITLGNSELPVGVYFYILKFNDGNRKPIQGRVYLSR